MSRSRSARVRSYTDSLKRGKPCQDCKGVFPTVCMDFDHRPGEVKLMDVSECRTLRQVYYETRKCDLVCANCHRIRTASRARTDESIEELAAAADEDSIAEDDQLPDSGIPIFPSQT